MELLKLAFAGGCILVLSACATSKMPPNMTPIQEKIASEAFSQGVPIHIALGIAEVESHFQPTAFSDGNYGLMQIRFGTANAMGFRGTGKDLMNPDNNIKYGVRYILFCQSLYSDERTYINCYNGAPSSRHHYATRVLRASEKFKVSQ